VWLASTLSVFSKNQQRRSWLFSEHNPIQGVSDSSLRSCLAVLLLSFSSFFFSSSEVFLITKRICFKSVIFFGLLFKKSGGLLSEGALREPSKKGCIPFYEIWLFSLFEKPNGNYYSVF
jgi:hypothetical protein